MLYEKEINTTKAKSDKLGIKSGLTQDEFNQAVLNALEKLSTASFQTSGATISSASDLTTTAGKNIAKSVLFEPGAGDVKITPNDASIDLQYDLKNALSSIPKDGELKRVNVMVLGKKTVVSNGDKKSQVISIAPNEFPVTLDVSIKGDTPDGSFILTSTQVYDGKPVEGLITFTKSETQAAPILTQEDLNIKLLQEIEYLKRISNSGA